MTTYNVYCDESCHLEHDHIPVMVLGAIWCPDEYTQHISSNLKEIKSRYNLKPGFETKWTKVSPGKIDFYKELIDFFYSSQKLKFRGVIINDKTKLNHNFFKQDHDTWYYKMWYVLFKPIIDENSKYRIYIDIKDTRSNEKVKKLHSVICNSIYDFNQKIIEKVQHVRSHEVELLQLADLIMGAIGYANRGLTTSGAKLELVNKIQEKSGLSLIDTTSLKDKTNILVWSPQEGA